MQTEISFIISAYNEERMIGSALENIIKRIKDSNIGAEVLIGVEGDDKTRAIAESYKAGFAGIKIFTFKKKMGKNKTVNLLIGKSKGSIIVIFDADRILTASLDDIKGAFKDGEVGGIAVLNFKGKKVDVEYFNDGQMLFGKVYEQIRLKKHLHGNSITAATYGCFIFRKSALKRPYISSESGDDYELSYKIKKAGYKLIYSPKLSYCLVNNSTSPRLTVSAIIKRRQRAEIFRSNAKAILHTNEFSMGSNITTFIHAIFVTLRDGNTKERLGFVKFMAIVAFAIILARIKMIFHGVSDPWQYRVR